jgi:high affinity sulfate transporter 1
MKPKQTNSGASQLPVLQGLLPIRWPRVPNELLAGVTLAALAIPEVMGYTQIAGMPVITGLYTLLLPMGLFALFGSSRHLVVGADSATAAMLASGLAGIATVGSAEYTALAGVLALMVAGLLLAARLLQLGFLANFLSRTVLIGFLTGVGLQVALGQLPGMFGLIPAGSGLLAQIRSFWQQIAQFNPFALAISAAVLLVIVGTRRISKRIPGPLLAVTGAIAASWVFDLGSRGVALLGAIPSGMPPLSLPAVTWSPALIGQLLPTAFGMFIIILAQSAATSRAYADRYNEPFNENVDLVGLGIANIGAALSGTFVVNGSPTKTQMVDSAGGQSQLAQLCAAVVVLLVLSFLTAPLAYLPQAALAAVVFLIGLELIDLSGMQRIYRERPWEFWVAVITAAIVVFWSVEAGILLAVFLSLVAHTRHGYRPKNTILARTRDGKWQTYPVSNPVQSAPGLIIYRFNHSMYYANSTQLAEEVQSLVRSADPPLTWFCLDFTAVDDVDFTAAETLHTIQDLLIQHNIRLVFSAVSTDIQAELTRSGLTERMDQAAFYASIGDVVDAYTRSSV